MRTVDELLMHAPVQTCFRAGADVEHWPDWLPHYRWVRFQEKREFGTGRVEMAARRDFGPASYPVWWVSDMHLDRARPAVHYRHVQGVTAGMDVVWTFESRGDATLVRIVHEWSTGPAWPLPHAARRLIAGRIIGPVFIHHVASRTLAGIRRHVEARK